ncbi:hypothetical protein PR202_gb27658 [Eleusine coracana subsp. coracana]|uniref:Uncharacterized protein n=1 Tax=Eleusine coracana subsp. coracana TaxID=191504 RepID=A0AAV5FV46_ELECO|nr:hypothetical protein PR202_gb27658 [Eleusine coracana subsp. coracana]
MATMSRGLSAVVLILCLSSLYYLPTPSSASSDGFLQCLREKIPNELIFTQGSSSFTDVLVSSIHNPMFFTNTTDYKRVEISRHWSRKQKYYNKLLSRCTHNRAMYPGGGKGGRFQDDEAGGNSRRKR